MSVLLGVSAEVLIQWTQVGRIHGVSATWTMAGESTAALPASEYRIQLSNGAAARLHVVSVQADSDDETKIARLLLSSEAAELEGRLEDALAHAEAVLAIDAESVSARIRKSDVLVARGELHMALSLLDEAEDISKRRFPNAHPPMLILQRQADLVEKL